MPRKDLSGARRRRSSSARASCPKPLSAAQAAGAEVTDEASAVEHLGLAVKVVSGRPTNLKVTHPGDERIAGLILGDAAVMLIRVGQGYDSHCLVGGPPLILGGIEIPFEKGLDGHLTPTCSCTPSPTPCWARRPWATSGVTFRLRPEVEGCGQREALEAVAARQGEGLVGRQRRRDARLRAPEDRPARRADARKRRAKLFGVSPEVVNLKAKTNEKMDDVGREADDGPRGGADVPHVTLVTGAASI